MFPIPGSLIPELANAGRQMEPHSMKYKMDSCGQKPMTAATQSEL